MVQVLHQPFRISFKSTTISIHIRCFRLHDPVCIKPSQCLETSKGKYPSSTESTEETVCDRIWENPPYGINAQFAQCAFLVPRVKNCRSSYFCHIHVKEPFFCYHRLRRLGVTYQGEISLYLRAPRSTAAVHGAHCKGR